MFDLNLLKVTNHGNSIENLKDSGINVTLSGLLIVFGMLILLVVTLIIFGFIMVRLSGGPKKEKKVKEPKVKKTAEAVSAPVSVQASAEDEDVIAAISAAVMMMYEGTGKTPVIRSIRPAQRGVRSAWATAGIMNNTRPF